MMDIIKPYTQPAFLICAGLLAVAGVGMERVRVEKVPFPLKKPLDLLDENGLGHYKVTLKKEIPNQEVIKTLGTEDYIQWVLEDTSAAADSATCKCSLFVTYYELPDNVPHVPEECYIGAGHGRPESDSLILEIRAAGASRSIPAKQLVFEDRRTRRKFSVFYLINVRGRTSRGYANSRERARWLLNKNIFSKQVYFCKVEWSFLSKSGARAYPKSEEAAAASEKLLSVILPILEEEHWPGQAAVNE
jgi:hypothetical protein